MIATMHILKGKIPFYAIAILSMLWPVV